MSAPQEVGGAAAADVAHEPQESYNGPATVRHGEVETVLDARLRGHFQPIDGLFHWWGRVAAHEALGDDVSGSTVMLRTAYGEAAGRLSDRDPWGRFRVSGTGRPPF